MAWNGGLKRESKKDIEKSIKKEEEEEEKEEERKKTLSAWAATAEEGLLLHFL